MANHYTDARGLYRIFNVAEYRFYRSQAGPPAETDTPWEKSETLPHTSTSGFTDGTWYLAMSYFNGVIDSGFYPAGPQGQLYILLQILGGLEQPNPPMGPNDCTLEQRPGGVVRVVAAYNEVGPNRGDEWALAYTFNGVDPPIDTPTEVLPASAGGLAILSHDLPAQADATTVKVRLQIRRPDGGGGFVYSTGSTVKQIAADAVGPAAPLAGERWPGHAPGFEEP